MANVLTLVGNMDKSLYARYIEEREGAILIEHPYGFAIYKLEPSYCYLQDIYVLPELRKSGHGVSLMNEVVEVAKKHGHTKLLGSVVPSTPFSDSMFKIMQGLGFKLHGSGPDIIYLVKEI